MLKYIYLTVTMFCFTSIATSQNCTYTYSGIVKDFHNGAPIDEAVLKIENVNKFVTTDSDGKFHFKNLCSSKFTVIASHVSCETKRISVDLSKEKSKIIFLEHHLEELNEVVVETKSRNEVTSIQQSISKNVLESFSDKSIGDALVTVSGVTSFNTGNSIVKPMIHGLHSSRLLLITNNVRLFDQDWGDEHAPNIDINAGGQIEVIKGANTLKYGSDAIGGLILINPETFEVKDSLFGSTLTSINTNGRGGNFNSEIVRTFDNGFYTKTQVSYKHFGDFETPDYMLTNTGVRSLNGSFRLGYNSFEKGFDAYYSYVDNTFGVLGSSHVGNVNDLHQALNSDEPLIVGDFSYDINNPRQEITHHLGKIEAYKRFKELGKLTLQYDFQVNRRKEYDTRRGNFKNTPVVNLRLFTHSLQSDLKIDAYKKLKINTGLLLRYQQNDAISGTGTSPLIPDYDKYEAGVYATGVYDLNDLTEVSAGFRYDFSKINATKRYNVTDWYDVYDYDELFPEFDTGIIEKSKVLTRPEFTFHNFSTSFGVKRELNDYLELLFNYGLASRMPNPSELFSDGLHHGAARIEIGKLTIGKETAHKFSASLEKNDSDFGFSINPYFNQINDFVQLVPIGVTTTIRGAFPVWEYDQIDARIWGVDVDVNTQITDRFNYKGSFSFLRGDNLSDDVPLIHMPSTNFSNTISYQNDKLKGLKISLQQTTFLKQNRYPDYNFYTFNPVTQQDVFIDISTPPSGYTLFNFNSSANFKVFKSNTLKVEFNVENIFNVSYRNYLNRMRYFADDLGRNFNIKLKLYY